MPYTLTPPEAEPAAPAGTYTLTPPDSVEATPRRGYAEEAARQAKLAARYTVEGLAGIPGIFANPITAAYNVAKQGSNAAFGTDFQRTKLPTEAVSSMLTSAGLPEPETAAERVSGDISRGIAGGGGFAGGAKKLGDLGVAGVNVLAANPAMQMVSGGSAGAGGGITREMGGGPVAQLLASLGAGFMPAGLEALATSRQVPATLPPDQAARQAAMQAVGVTNPPRAAITRDPNEWYRTQELGKVEGANKAALAESANRVNEQLGGVLPGMRAGPEASAVDQAERMRLAVKAYETDAKNVASGTYDAVPKAVGSDAPFPAATFFEKAGPLLADFEDSIPGAVKKRIQELQNGMQPAQAKVARPVSGVDPSKDDVITAIRKFGGINPGDEAVGSLAKANPFPPDPRYGAVWRNPSTGTSSSNKLVAGHSLDDMAAKLKQAGYIEEADPNLVMDKIADSTMGGPQYSAYFEHKASDPLATAISQLTEQLAVKNAPAQGPRREFTVGEAAKLYKLINDTTGKDFGTAGHAGGLLKSALADAAGGLQGESGTAMQLFKDATQQWRALKTTLEPGPISKLAKADEAPPNFSDTLIGGAASKPGEVASLMKLLRENHPEAAQALHDSALDYLSGKALDPVTKVFSGTKLGKAMEQPGMMERLQAVLLPDEIQHLQKLRTASEALTSAPDKSAVNYSGSGSTLGNLARKVHAGEFASAGLGEVLGPHFGLPPVFGALAGGAMASGAKALAARRQAAQLQSLLDPEFMRPRTLSELAGQIGANLPAAGIGTTAGMRP